MSATCPIPPAYKEEMRALFKFYREKSWVAFARDVLLMDLEPQQVDLFNTVQRNERVAVRACHAGGKTLSSGCLALTFMSLYPYGVVFSTAPTNRQVEKLLWTEIGRRFASSRLPALGYPAPLIKSWKIAPGWEAFGAASDENFNIEGVHSPTAILIIVDEAKGVKDRIFESLEGMMNSPLSRQVRITTPGPASGEAYECMEGKKKHLWVQRHWSALDIPRLHTWAERCKLEWGEDSPIYRMRVLAEYCDEAMMKVFPDYIRRAFRENAANVSHKGERVLAVDVSREGDDKSVLTYREGAYCGRQEAFQGKRTNEVADIVIDRIPRNKIERVIVDGIGLGAGVMDNLAEKGLEHLVSPFKGVNAAFDPGLYANRKTEVAFKLRKRMEDGLVGGLLSDDLDYDLKSYDYIITAKEQYKLVDPESGSPDFGDSFLMAFSVDDTTGAACARSSGDATEEGDDGEAGVVGDSCFNPQRRSLMMEAERGNQFLRIPHRGRVLENFRGG